MLTFRLLAFFLIGCCQFSFGQLRQRDERQVGESDDFGTVSAAAGDANNLWQGPTLPPVTHAPCSPNCDPSTSGIKRSDSPTQPDANIPEPSEKVSQSSQQPLTPVRKAAEFSAAARRAASVGDWSGAIKAIHAAVTLSPNDPQLRQQENILLKLAPKDLKDKFDMDAAGRQAQNLTGSAQTDSALAAPQGLPQAKLGSYLGQISPVTDSQPQASTPYNPVSPRESKQLRSAYQGMIIGDYAGAENILQTVVHQNSGSWTAHTLLAKAFLSQPNPDYERARIEASRALNIHGSDSDMLQVLASALIHLVRNEVAVNDLKRYLNGITDENKRMAEAHFILSQAYRRDEQHLDELKNLSAAASYDPEQFSKLYDEARVAYKRQIKEEPNKATYPRWELVLGVLLFLAAIATVLRQVLQRDGKSANLRKASPSSFGLRNHGTAAGEAISWSPGSHLNENLDVIKLLGHGGMGEVYLAFDKSLDRKVAIKRMLPAISQIRSDRERFVREARSVSKLDNHPNIVRIHHILEMPNELALVFEYIEGETLSQILERKQRLSFDEARRYLKPVCDALRFAHQRAIYHRDIKPSNIMLSKDGVLKVMDFGIAREAKTTMGTFTQTIMGTPAYMAPEMEMGLVGKEADIYSLGVTLYELLSGETPFAGANGNQDKKNMNFRPLSSFIRELPTGIDEFIAHALQPNPTHRIKSPGQFLAGLDKLSVVASSAVVKRVRRFWSIHGITPSQGAA
jgi:hypothetical protein